MFTDLLIYFLILLLITRGALRGLGASLIDPISVILATSAAYFFLKNYHNIPVTLAIGILGPLILYRVLKGLFILGNPPSIPSRILGAFLTLIWGLIFLLPMIYLLTFLPPVHPILQTVNKDIKASVIIASLSKEFDKRIFQKKDIKKPIVKKQTMTVPKSTANGDMHTATMNNEVINDQGVISKENFIKDPNNNESNPHDLPSLEEFLNDPRIVEIRSDPEIKVNIEKKNYAALMANSKIVKLMQDPEFIKTMMQELKKKQESGEIPTNP